MFSITFISTSLDIITILHIFLYIFILRVHKQNQRENRVAIGEIKTLLELTTQSRFK